MALRAALCAVLVFLPIYAQAATIEGRVTSATSGEPIDFVAVGAYDELGFQRSSARTMADGRFELSLPQGTYFVEARSERHISEVWDDVACPESCDVATVGEPIVVADGDSVVSGIDFALRDLGRIAGRVTEAADGMPVSDGFLEIRRLDGVFFGNASMDADGQYVSDPLPAGDYAVVVTANGFVTEAYDAVWCPGGFPFGCELADLTPVQVLDETTTMAIDFALDRLGSISGTVVDAATAEPLPFIDVRAWSESGVNVANGVTDGSGHYALGGIEPGLYTVSTRFAGNYVDELYDDVPCFRGVEASSQCQASDGTPVSVSVASTAANIDFALDLGGEISGRARVANTGAALRDIVVRIYDASGELVAAASTDGDGRYVVRGLPAGDYTALATDATFPSRNPEVWAQQLFDHLPCPVATCSPLDGTPITVALGQTTDGIDFDLLPLGRIEGRVSDAQTGVAIADAQVVIQAANGRVADTLTTDADGRYASEGLISAEYFISVEAEGYLRTLYPSTPCLPGCDLTSGEPVTVEVGVVRSDVDVGMTLGGSISGSVRDVMGQPVEVRVQLFDAVGSAVRGDFTQDGVFRFVGLPGGDYFLVTESNDYAAEVWNDRVCPRTGCQPTTGDAIRVDLGRETSGIDVELMALGRIEGRVTEIDTELALTDATLDIFDLAGQFVARGFYSQQSNRFVSSSLLPGTYFVVASQSGYRGQVYGGEACGDVCEPTTGTPIVIGFGSVVTDVDIPLKRLHGIIGRVTNADTGLGVAGVEVTAWRATDGALHDAVVTGPSGGYSFGMNTGVYTVATANQAGADDLVWPDVPCPGGPRSTTCDVGAGDVITAFAHEPVEGIDFALEGFEALCQPSSTTLCLNRGRFRVQATWRDADGGFDFGGARAITGDTGYFYFFDDDNVEVVVKVLDACGGSSERFWVFAAGLTDLEVGLTVTDTLTEETQTYTNDLGTPFDPILDTDAFATCDSGGRRPPGPSPWMPGGRESAPRERVCTAGAEGLCLNDQRFRVEASWRSTDGGGTAIGEPLTGDTGYFWFFGPDNVEVVVKVLDACFSPIDRFWVFAAGLTDVELTLRVIDTETGEEREYLNALGDPFQPVLDTQAFATCTP